MIKLIKIENVLIGTYVEIFLGGVENGLILSIK